MTPEISIPAPADAEDVEWFRDELAFAWRTAQDEAIAAYEAWRASPGRGASAVYRAAQDRADQAQDALAAWAAYELHAGLPDEEYPSTRALARQLRKRPGDAEFTRGLQVLVAGLTEGARRSW